MIKYWNMKIAAAALLASAICAVPVSAVNYYVGTTGDDGNDGLTLATAKRTAQAAIAGAVDGDTILINDGVYELNETVEIKKGVMVRSINGRDAVVLDGKGSRRCVELDHAAARIESVTIRNGRRTFQFLDSAAGVNNIQGVVYDCLITGNLAFLGGGVVNGANAWLIDCEISGNTASAAAGGAVNSGVISNCVVQGNVGELGVGGIYNLSNARTVNSTIRENVTPATGGGVYNSFGIVEHCDIIANMAKDAGGIYNDSGERVAHNLIQDNVATDTAGGLFNLVGTVENCVISGNTASEGGGLVNTNSGVVSMCVVSNNTAGALGGGAVNASIITNCTIAANNVTAGNGAGVFNRSAGSILACTVVYNRAVSEQPGMVAGGGVANDGGLVMYCTIADNEAMVGAGVYNNAGTVQFCLIERNAGYAGGGVFNYGNVWDCVLRQNRALGIEGVGGGMYCEENSDTRNCLIVGNLALGAGGVFNEGAMYNCTIAGNEALAQAGGLANAWGALNCVIWGNTAPDDTDYLTFAGGAIAFSCLPLPVAEQGNITNNPCFINPGTGFGTNHVYGDYRLALGSPCVDAGWPVLWMQAPDAVDLDGNPRIIYAKPDMGVYEYFAPPTVVSATDGLHADRVSITWNAAIPAPAAYELWRATVNDHNQAALLAATTELACNDSTAIPGVTYYYWVRPVLAGRGPFSVPDTGWRSLLPPTGFVASDGLYTDGVRLTWNASAGAVNYKVYRGVSAEFNAADEIARPASSPWLDTGATVGVLYHYWICAVGETGQSATTDPDTGWRRSHAAGQNAWSDFDGDGLLDLAVFNPQTGYWRILLSGSGYMEISLQLGGANCVPVTGDFNGDGLTDPAIYRESNGEWSVFLHDGNFWRIETRYYGGNGYQAVPGDYDGDGRTDFAVYHRTGGHWRGLLSRAGYAEAGTQFGGTGWQPAPADFDGDGKTDPAIYNTVTGDWLGMLSGSNYQHIGTRFGGTGWMPVPADFDGDFIADPAIYNIYTGQWRALFSGSDYAGRGAYFGGADWRPLPADYDGDGKADVVVCNYVTGQWRALFSGSDYAERGAYFGGAPWQTLR